MSVKIHSLSIENVKSVRAVTMQPTPNGLTVIGGKNRAGKTSVLDAIAWALGGERFRPSQPQRDGSVLPPDIHIVMNNGLVVERKGKNSSLKVIDPSGRQSGQQVLNGFVEQLALDLPRFMNATSKDKAETLLKIIGVSDQLSKLDRQEQELYNHRRVIGQIADQKSKFAKEMTYHPNAPKEPVSASELIKRQQDILTRNGENHRKRENLHALELEAIRIQEELDKLLSRQTAVLLDLDTARKSALDLQDESTEALERDIEQIEEINRKVRANLDKEKAEDDAREHRAKYDELSAQIDQTRDAKTALLGAAELPLPGLSVMDGELMYNGYQWDNLSGSQQLKVATAIVRKLNPQCGFVILDKLEQMDLDTLQEFGDWLEQEGLQAIATRVSMGGECAILIEDGYAVEETTRPATPIWKEGSF